jgi:hypothetical protein
MGSKKYTPFKAAGPLLDHVGNVLDLGPGGVGRVILCLGGGFRVASAQTAGTPLSSDRAGVVLDLDGGERCGGSSFRSVRKRHFFSDVSVSRTELVEAGDGR